MTQTETVAAPPESPTGQLKLWGWPADRAGCAWYRIITPLEAVQAHYDDIDLGWDPTMPHTVLDEPDRLVMLQRSTTPVTMMVLDEFQQKSRPWVYDIDDLLWNLTPDNPAYSYYAKQPIMQRLHWHLRNAPLVTVSTPDLAEEALEIGARRVAVVPNTLPDSLFDATEARGFTEREKVTVLWRGSPTHTEDVKILRYAMTRLAKRDDVRLVFAGTDYRKQLGVPDAEFLPWVDSPDAYVRQIIELAPDITLCPLAHTRFNRSKSHVNALEGAAAGAVPVASVVPAYSRFITDGVDGLLVKGSPDAWYKAIRELVEDRVTLRRVRAQAFENALQYRASALAPQLRDLLTSVG